MDTFSTNQRIGILGGSFNPVHMGHLLLAQSAFESADLTKVLFIPCATSPHKTMTQPAPASHRVHMLESAISADLRFDVSDVEIKRGGISFAVDTVSSLHELYPEAELFFIIGADTLLELHLWKDIDHLLDLCTFLVVERPGFDPKSLSSESFHLKPDCFNSILENRITGRQVNISSSDIRRRLAEGMSIRYLVPDEVEMYITEHGLYQ